MNAVRHEQQIVDSIVTMTTPLFSSPLHVGRPNVGDQHKLLARIQTALDRNWFTNNGPLVQEFEAKVAEYLEVAHCIAVSNATIGLQLAISALDLTGEVIVPSFTFPATPHALAWQGVRPVFCDVDPNTHNLDPRKVERLIGPETSGILGVHLWGNVCDTAGLIDIANRRGLKLLFDAAHAFGCSHDGVMVGNFGNAEVFSFHATKFLSCGEGGAITTNDDAVAARLRRLRNFGIEEDQFVGIGTNGKMPEFAAAMGLTALEKCDEFIARNKANLQTYEKELSNSRGLALFKPNTQERRNYQYVVVEIDSYTAGLSRDEVIGALHAQNILAKRYFYPGCHRLQPYRADHELRRSSLPHTEHLCDRLIQLPTGSGVSQTDIVRIGGFLRHLTSRARKAA
jgi:dTDP-4-amino-4,6-dideoxygalactose transaminase